MVSFKIQFLILGLFRLARGQFMDPVLGPLAPLPNHLIAIRGPLYVDAGSLVPTGPMAVGAPMMGPPPMVGPTQIIGGPVVGPPPMMQAPMGAGFVQLAYDETNDPVNQRPPPTASRRSANTNVQSGIQQFGTGNMNLQGNIQQISQP